MRKGGKYMSIGENIKKHRKMKGITLEDLALKTRLGKATIEKYESDERQPELDHLLKISTSLDIPLSELVEKETQSFPIDTELEQLVQKIGIERAKLILRKFTDLTEDEFGKIMQSLYEMRYK